MLKTTQGNFYPNRFSVDGEGSSKPGNGELAGVPRPLTQTEKNRYGMPVPSVRNRPPILVALILLASCRPTSASPPPAPTCQERYLRAADVCECRGKGDRELNVETCDTKCLSSAWQEYDRCAVHEPTSI